jgi:DNA-binding IclR family transcriptional regulator
MPLTDIAKHELAYLQREFGFTTRLAILSGEDIVYAEQTRGYDSPRLRFGIGDRGILYASAAGKAVLAFLDSEMLIALLHRVRVVRLTAKTRTRPDDIRRDLIETRARGYAISDEEVVDGIRSIGVPVLDGMGRPVAAITMLASAEGCSMAQLESIAPRLQEAAARIGQKASSPQT